MAGPAVPPASTTPADHATPAHLATPADLAERLPPGYPRGWESDVVLRDGGTVHIRPIRPGDAPAIEALHGRLSAETIYFRFFSPLTTLSPRLLERFVHVDYVDRLALVAVLGDDIIAVGRYERLPSRAAGGDEAEVAFLVDDAQQGRGLGTVLLEQLAVYARAAGITRFVADTLPDNSRMLRVFHEAGFGDERTFADGVVRVAFPIAPTETSLALAQEREREAAARSVRRLLSPRSVAVIGASRDPETLGQRMLRSLLDTGFNGPVFPVNPQAGHVCSVRAYPTVADVPDQVDLAVVVVPAAAVPAVVEQCVRKHVGALVIISSGFADRDEDGREAERRLVAEARRNGMRLVGPSSMGVVNTDPDVRLGAAFATLPPPGHVGFIAQSGALGVVVLDELARREVGVSSFVSTGNKADISGNDLLQYWEGDDATRVICMYLETFGNPRTFARVARRVGRHKPIVMVKSGRAGPAGPIAEGAGELPAGDVAVDALLRQTGVIRTATLEELFDVAQVLVSQPLPAGRRVAIVGSSGGPGVLAADACRAAGLEVATLSAATRTRLRAEVPEVTAVADPVGLPPDARPDQLGRALEAVLADDGVDGVIALYTSLLASPVDAVAAAVDTAAATAPGKPVVASILGRRGLLGTAGRPGPAGAGAGGHRPGRTGAGAG
ncbi:MAG TPA: GNAT family N-acetyltransferase, partial [Acidimicrobiales bacterium]|nr:GNAT family N-acetyltransferase [Acidimicrobiales bacterium]